LNAPIIFDASRNRFEDAEEMLDQDSILAQIENDDDDDDSDEDDDDDEKLEKKANKASKASVSSSSSTTAGLSASMQAVMASSKKKSTLDEDLAIDTGCTVAEARKLRHAVMAFYKAEKSLGFLKGHGFDGVSEWWLGGWVVGGCFKEGCGEREVKRVS
jgi:hypothetical protein